MQRPCLLEAGHQVEDFDCGNEALNEYLARFAMQNQRNGSGRTHVVLDGNRVIGFYTVASTAVEPAEAPERMRKGLARHPIPAVILGRFAVDHRYQGQGIGSALLRDALGRIAQVSEDIGIRTVVVDAKDEKAKAFYMGIGFTPFTPEDMRLYLLLKDLRKTLGL